MYVYMCVVDGDRNKYIESRICVPNLTLLFWIYSTQRAVTTYFHMLNVTCACSCFGASYQRNRSAFCWWEADAEVLADGDGNRGVVKGRSK
jgi:hypothetical protein